MIRPAFEPTDERRRQAETLAGLGLTQDQIALIIGCDPKTLRKHFDHELKVGDARATEKVAKSLFERATSGEGRDAVTAAIFWMKARAKWSERHELQVTGKGGGPIETVGVTSSDPIEAAKIYQRLMNG